MMKDVMLDLETIGIGRDAAVVQVAAVRFDPFLQVEGFAGLGAISTPEGSFNRRVSLMSPDLGSIDGPTLRFWLDQPERTRQQVFEHEGSKELRTVLGEFAEWYRGAERCWACPPGFDVRILNEAYKRLGFEKSPIHFRHERDFRTLRWIGNNLKVAEPEFVGKEHDALDDAHHQAGWAIQVLQRIHGRLPA